MVRGQVGPRLMQAHRCNAEGVMATSMPPFALHCWCLQQHCACICNAAGSSSALSAPLSSQTSPLRSVSLRPSSCWPGRTPAAAEALLGCTTCTMIAVPPRLRLSAVKVTFRWKSSVGSSRLQEKIGHSCNASFQASRQAKVGAARGMLSAAQGSSAHHQAGPTAHLSRFCASGGACCAGGM